MSGKQITLTLSLKDAMIVRVALTDAKIALRTFGDDNLMSEEKFLSDLTISEMRRQRYLTLKDYANLLNEFCQ